MFQAETFEGMIFGPDFSDNQEKFKEGEGLFSCKWQ